MKPITENTLVGICRRLACAKKDVEKLTLELGRALSVFFNGAKSRHDQQRMSSFAQKYDFQFSVLQECLAVAEGECLPYFAAYGHIYVGLRVCRRIYLNNLRMQEKLHKSGVVWVDPITRAEKIVELEALTSKQISQIDGKNHFRTVAEQNDWLDERIRRKTEMPINHSRKMKVLKDKILLPTNSLTFKQFITLAPQVMTLEQAMQVVQQIIAAQKNAQAA